MRKILPPAATPAREGRERALVQNQAEGVRSSPPPLRGDSKDDSRPAIWASPPPDHILDALAKCPGFSGRLPGIKRTSG